MNRTPSLHISLLTLLLLSVHTAYGQSLTWHHLSISGANNYVRELYQDETGYLWMATMSGLYRYDGYNVQPFAPTDEDERRLMPDYHILTMRPWHGHYLWLRLRGNVYSLFDTRSNHFVDYKSNHSIRVPSFSKPRQLADGRVETTDNHGNREVFDPDGRDVWYTVGGRQHHISHIFSPEMTRRNGSGKFYFVSGGDGVLWISTYGNGLFAFDTHSGTLRHYLSSDKNSPIRTDYLIALMEDREGSIWVSEEYYGLTCITKGSLDGHYVYFTNEDDHSHDNVIRLLKNVGGKVYVGNLHNGFKVSADNLNSMKAITGYDDDVIDVEAGHDGTLWLGMRQSGLYVGKRHYVHNATVASSLSKGKLSDIAIDRKGRAWISFFRAGVDLAVKQSDGTYTFRHFFTGKNAVPQPRMMTVDHRGDIWLCSNDGVYRFNPDSLILTPSAYHHYNIAVGVRSADECHCIYESGRHQIFVGTIGSGMAIIPNDGKGGKMRLLTTADGLPSNSVEAIAEDQNGNIWIGTDNGLASLSPRDNTVRSYRIDADALGNIFNEGAATRLASGLMAMGTRHGILLFDPLKMKQSKPKFHLAISDMQVNGIPIRSLLNAERMPDGMASTRKLKLSHNENSLTFFFSDFELANAETSMYTCKLEGYDRDWSPLSTINSAQYKNLPFGHYTMRVRSRNGSGEWNPHEVVLQIRITPPFYLSWWAILIYIILLCAIIYYLYRNAREKLQLRQRVEIENRMTEYKLRFFTNISHEFRTPLTLIEGAMDHIDSLGNMPGKLKQPIANMRKSVDRMLRLVNQLLEFRKMQNDRLHLALETTDVVAFARNVCMMFSDAADNKRINYTFLPFDSQYQMPVDKGFLDKILYNLISNAFKYTPRGREISVRLRHGDGKVLFFVADTGIGIDEDKRKDLFTRFDQSSYTHDSMGIGLHLTAELVRVHHGAISFEPNPKGGSIFTVALPDSGEGYNADDFLVSDNQLLIEQNEKEDAMRLKVSQPTYKELAAGPMNDVSVLVVEDDTDVATFLKTELGHYFNVVQVGNGQEALDLLKKGDADFSLVISDIRMPVMNGLELTKAIRADQSISDMPVILLTALTTEDKQLKGIGAGADAYIEKPFSMPVLLAKAKQLIDQRERLRHTYAATVATTHEAPAIIIEEQDAKLREKLDTWLLAHIDDQQLNIDDFAKSMGYGRTTFYKKVKTLVGLTPNEYVKQLRMNKAAELLADDTLTMAQVAYQVGISDPLYFSKVFKSFFGQSPTAYRKGKGGVLQAETDK